MKRLAPLLLCLAGIVLLAVLVPRFNAAQPRGVRITRGEAKAIANAAAKSVGIPVDNAWSNEIWYTSPYLEKELERDPARMRRAQDDPVVRPRLGAYRINYYRRGGEKGLPHGYVSVSGRTGEVLSARLRMRPEEPGLQPTEAELRPKADAFVHARVFPGAPNPQFESARPTIQRRRTDWTFRYRVPSRFPTGNVVPYLNVVYLGGRFAGWELVEEYADGSPFRGDNGGDVAGVFVGFGALYGMLLLLLIIFLRKYHAGEVGVGSGMVLFAAAALINIIADFLMASAASEGVGMGGLDAQSTAVAQMGFKFLFSDLPLAVLIFFGWSVGESYARERWGERLASFDALLRRDPLNATVGRSLLRGVLTAPAVAAAAFLSAVIPLIAGLAYPSEGGGTGLTLTLTGPAGIVLNSAMTALLFPVVTILFVLAWTSRRRVLPLGIVGATLLGMIGGAFLVPMEPLIQRCLFAFGGIVASIGVFLAYDLLATVTAMFGAAMLVASLPLLSVAQGRVFNDLAVTVAVPIVLIGLFGVAALLTQREVVYTYEDLAPHVKRIVERERVKAEIDAANRIQAALLPLDTPSLAGASVASHYRAATEIGGDYFDFLLQPTGEIGIAFGDVSGHGLTSGIVMAMAKAALLVQVENDPSPAVVLNVLNDIVMKTAPKRILMTFFFGLLNPDAQQLRFSSAGHLDPYVFRAAKRQLEPLSSWGFPLGVRRREPFREHEVEFAAGDRLILYSDGLIEAVDDDGEPFGFERFERVLLEHGNGSAEDIKKALLQSIRKFTRNRPPEDDQTLVVVSFDEVMADMLRPVVTSYSDHVN